MIAFNRILVLPFEDEENYNDTAKTAPVSGVVVDVPKFISKTDGPDDFSERVHPGETVWFSPLAERWGKFLFVDYDQLFAVERNGLIPLGDHTIVKCSQLPRLHRHLPENREVVLSRPQAWH